MISSIAFAKTTVRIFIILCMSLFTTACGWHLRGTIDLPSNVDSVYINNQARDDTLAEDLIRLLSNNGATLTESSSAADMVISILDFDQNRRINGVTSNTLVSEYELINEAEFEVRKANGEILLEPTTSSLSRNYRFDRNAVISAAEEEKIINSELRLELAQQIVRRLQFLNESKAQ